VNLPELTGKAKYIQRPIVNKYREGKVKRTPGGSEIDTETIYLQGVTTGAFILCGVPIEE
jgi:hypothetical protein